MADETGPSPIFHFPFSILHSRRVLPYLALAVIAIATYQPTLRYPLIYDDLAVIERNPVVTQPGGWSKVVTEPYWPRTESLDPLYRPLTTLTFKLNYAGFGPEAMSFRAVNITLHALVTLLVAALAGRLWARSVPHPTGVGHPDHPPLTPHPSLLPAWVAGVLFAVHPIHTEALGLVVGRAELLAALFVCWILLRHLRRSAAPLPLITHHSSLITPLLFLAALCSKEHAVVAWPMILLIDWWSGPHGAGRGAWRAYLNRLVASHHLGLLVALFVFLLTRWLIFGASTTLPADLVSPFANPLRGASVATYAAAALALLWLILRQWFAAAPLCPIWSVGGFNLPSDLISAEIIAGAVVAAAVLVVALVLGWRRARRPIPRLAENNLGLVLGIFVLSVLLPCHFIPSANWLYAERWAYLPSVFLALACAGLAAVASRLAAGGATVAAALLLATTIPYERSWSDQETLFRSVVQRQPNNYHGNVGLLGYLERTDRLAEGAAHADRLVQRIPQAERAWYFKTLTAAARDDWSAAEAALRRWAKLRPLAATPPRIEEIAAELRRHGRGLDIDL